MSAIDRAAEILDEMQRAIAVSDDLIPEGMTDGDVMALALAAADPPLLVTDESQALIDAAVGYHKAAPGLRNDLDLAVIAYLASRGEA